FSTIGLIGRLDNDSARRSVLTIIQFLQSRKLNLVVDRLTADGLSGMLQDNEQTRIANIEVIGETCDLAIVVGGDGSLLSGARDLTGYGVPLLGVNRGRLGFLTDILPEDIESKIGEVLDGQYVAEERFLLDMKVVRNGQVIATGDALNDVVLHPGEFIRMLEFELYIDD